MSSSWSLMSFACQTLPGLPRAARPSGRFWSQHETKFRSFWSLMSFAATRARRARKLYLQDKRSVFGTGYFPTILASAAEWTEDLLAELFTLLSRPPHIATCTKARLSETDLKPLITTWKKRTNCNITLFKEKTNLSKKCWRWTNLSVSPTDFRKH